MEQIRPETSQTDSLSPGIQIHTLAFSKRLQVQLCFQTQSPKPETSPFFLITDKTKEELKT